MCCFSMSFIIFVLVDCMLGEVVCDVRGVYNEFWVDWILVLGDYGNVVLFEIEVWGLNFKV